MVITIIILSILSIILFMLLFLVKKEILSIKEQLHEYSKGVEKPIDVALVDKDLVELAAEINRNQAFQKQNKILILRKENHIKETISSISHDLRTPLTSIIGYLQLLQKTELTDEQRQYLNISISRSQYLQTLISDFYDISVLENKNNILILTKVNLDNILADIVLSFTEQFEQKNITPTITFLHIPTYVMADKTMLKRVITNLISNVIRYGRSKLKIEILEKNYIEVRFQNIVEDERDIDTTKLFEKFYTSDSSLSQSGSGLGLYIVKMLIEKMSGNISASLKGDKLIISLSLIKA